MSTTITATLALEAETRKELMQLNDNLAALNTNLAALCDRLAAAFGPGAVHGTAAPAPAQNMNGMY